MKNRSKLIIFSLLIIFTVSFSFLTLSNVFLSLLTGLSGTITLKDIILISVISILLTGLIFVILLFERLNQVVQIDLIYIILNIGSYTMSFIVKMYQNKVSAVLISLVVSVIGLVLLTVIVKYFNDKEDKNLNESLTSYKERE